MKPTIWKNCYIESWKGILIEQAFQHPAKISLALAKKIFEHAIAKGWIQKSDCVLDPFAGIGGVAFAAGLNGIRFVGQELEQHFVDMANGVDCEGISKEDWIRFYGRWDQAHKSGRRWCPRCIALVKEIVTHKIETENLFGAPVSSAYVRNSGKIPSTQPHHFEGNLEFWRRRFNLDGAVIVQGDSRKLLENLSEQVQCVVSSPPWEQSKDASRTCTESGTNSRQATSERGKYEKKYGYDQANLGNLPAGNIDAVISSPPYARLSPEKSSGSIDLSKQYETYKASGGGASFDSFCKTQLKHSQGYGSSEGQLAQMPQGNIDAVISSPPYVQSVHGGNGIEKNKLTGNKTGANSQAFAEGYGNHAGQLAAMPEGSFDLVASSPPFEESIGHDGGKKHLPLIGNFSLEYGKSFGQLGVESGETFWSAAREIVQQCFLALRPGGHAIWVTKRFVRDGEIVEFSQQWAMLCESVGFKVVCWHHALLVDEGAAQVNLDGQEEIKKTERKSFFRRLAEKNGSPRIDWEDVICMVKPE